MQNKKPSSTLYTRTFETPLGELMAIAEDEALCVLEFHNASHLLHKTKHIKKPLIEQTNGILDQVKQELIDYFNGTLETFQTPLRLDGTPFQEKVWQTLRKIPYGTSASYKDLANQIGEPRAHRAAANANGKNRIVIMVPCHRIILSSGHIGGYSSGIVRKKWLLQHEAKHATVT